jgi:hypothetical protein
MKVYQTRWNLQLAKHNFLQIVNFYLIYLLNLDYANLKIKPEKISKAKVHI